MDCPLQPPEDKEAGISKDNAEQQRYASAFMVIYCCE